MKPHISTQRQKKLCLPVTAHTSAMPARRAFRSSAQARSIRSRNPKSSASRSTFRRIGRAAMAWMWGGIARPLCGVHMIAKPMSSTCIRSTTAAMPSRRSMPTRSAVAASGCKASSTRPVAVAARRTANSCSSATSIWACGLAWLTTGARPVCLRCGKGYRLGVSRYSTRSRTG